jgi:cell wall-associated NlpC family hydrolase
MPQRILLFISVALLMGLLSACGSNRQASSKRYVPPTKVADGGRASNHAPATTPGKKSTKSARKVTSTPLNKGTANATPITPKPAGKPKQTAEKIITEAKTYLNTPYKWGGTGRSGIDCSALMQNSFRVAGVSLPRTADAQALLGKPIKKSEVRPGDVIYFDTMKRGQVGHAGLVVEASGDDIAFIHASVKGGVRIDRISNPYWSRYYLFAKRLLN